MPTPPWIWSKRSISARVWKFYIHNEIHNSHNNLWQHRQTHWLSVWNILRLMARRTYQTPWWKLAFGSISTQHMHFFGSFFKSNHAMHPVLASHLYHFEFCLTWYFLKVQNHLWVYWKPSRVWEAIMKRPPYVSHIKMLGLQFWIVCIWLQTICLLINIHYPLISTAKSKYTWYQTHRDKLSTIVMLWIAFTYVAVRQLEYSNS